MCIRDSYLWRCRDAGGKLIIVDPRMTPICRNADLYLPVRPGTDMALYMGLLVYYAVAQRTSYVVLSAVATAGSVMVSYSRARAESLIPLCKVGFMERPERMVLLILGGLFNRMAPALWVIAIVATLTVIHRIVHTWQETKAGRTLPGIRLSL